jgi:hypothetical protein
VVAFSLEEIGSLQVSTQHTVDSPHVLSLLDVDSTIMATIIDGKAIAA